MATGHTHLLRHQRGQVGSGLRSLQSHRGGLRHRGQRRLDGVGQIARLRARARHDLGVAIEHRIEIIDQGLHLERKFTLQACRRAGLHLGQLALQRAQGCQADGHLRPSRGAQQREQGRQ